MISEVRDYARVVLKSLGYQEWKDAFNVDNIPSTLLDKVFHVEHGIASQRQNNQQNLELIAPFSVTMFRKGFRDPNAALDDAAVLTDTIIKEFLAPENRLTQQGTIKNIAFESAEMTPISASNDNAVLVKVAFSALCVQCLRLRE